MTVNFPYSKRVSFHQMETLIEYMDVHRDLAVGVCKTTEARAMAKRLWTEIAQILNGVEGGARKSGVNWSKHWSDYKIKLKYKLKSEKSSDPEAKSRLTNLDKRALMFLGHKFGYDVDPLTVNHKNSQVPIKRELLMNKRPRQRKVEDNIVLETRHQPFQPDNQMADALMILAEAAKEQAEAMRSIATSIAEGVHAIKMLVTNQNQNNSSGG